ncbi:MAG TPA: hypothetical protein P5244_08705 [Syntrophales bacterium]|nr:hypothetical protein [Syntrophales bacterium]HRT26811.1 hypothetical protein [Syntrophales bacterium]
MKRLTFLKVFASYLILILITAAVLDFFLTQQIKDIMAKGMEDELFSIARITAFIPGERIQSDIPEIAKQLNVRLTLIDTSGLVLADSQADASKMDNHLNRPEIQQAVKEGKGKSSRFSVTIQESMLYVALPVKENSRIKGYIRLARPMTAVTKSIDILYRAIHLTLYIIAIPSLILALIFSRYMAARLTDD